MCRASIRRFARSPFAPCAKAIRSSVCGAAGAGSIDIVREKDYDNSKNFQLLTEEIVNRAGRTGGTFLHTSRTRPSKVKKDSVPAHLQSTYTEDVNDLTPEVLKNLDWLGIDYLIPIGGDDTLSYGVHLYKEGVKVVAIPKTMDNDVPGTDYCIGFSTCVTRTIEMVNSLRTSAGSHERIHGAGSVRTLRRLHGDAADDGGRGQSLRDPRAQIRHRASDRVAGAMIAIARPANTPS